MGIELEALEVEAIGEMDLRGTLGIDREVPVGFTSIRCETRVRVKDDGRPFLPHGTLAPSSGDLGQARSLALGAG